MKYRITLSFEDAYPAGSAWLHILAELIKAVPDIAGLDEGERFSFKHCINDDYDGLAIVNISRLKP